MGSSGDATPRTRPLPSEDEVFLSDDLYPDAANLFVAQHLPLDRTQDDCLVVPDTNVLLMPYSSNQQTLAQIESVYRGLIEQDRLFVPAQVAREFVRNRPAKLIELFQRFSRARPLPLGSPVSRSPSP